MNSDNTENAPLLPGPSRVYFLDNLRTSLVALVVAHHAAIPYTGIGTWVYMSPFRKGEQNGLLTIFCLLNQSFFMGALFFISGHMSAVAADRKTWPAFCLDKLRRLGIPILVYCLLLGPLGMMLGKLGSGDEAKIPAMLQQYFRTIAGSPGRGPVWYISSLLIFDLVSVTLRKSFPRLFSRIQPPKTALGYRVWASLSMLSVMMSSFVIRLRFPVGTISPKLPIIQPAYAPQYIVAYIAGAFLPTIEKFIDHAHPGRNLILFLVAAIASLCSVARVFGGDPRLYVGGVNFPSIFYVVWNELCFYFITTNLYTLFRNSNTTRAKWRNIARYSYGVYLLHMLAVIALQILVDVVWGGAPRVLKAIVAAAIGIPLSWYVSYAVLCIPGVGKII